MCALITKAAFKQSVTVCVCVVVCGGVSAGAAGWLGERQHYVTPSPPPSLPPAAPPPLHPLILQQATGQVSRHWLHLLHLGCLAFFSSPKWSCKFHVAGRVTDWGDGSQQMGD